MRISKEQLLKIIFFFLGLIPILPFKFKPLGLALGLIFGLFYAIKNGIKTHRNFIYGVGLFLLYAISVFYSDNQKFALKYLETSMPFVLFPLFFLFISKIEINYKKWKKIELMFYKTYFFSSVVYSILIFIYIYSLGYFQNKVTYDFCISYLSAYFWGFADHAIYASMFLMIALLFAPYLLKNDFNKKQYYFFGGIIIFLALIFLARKGVFIAGFLAALVLLYMEVKSKKTRNRILIGIVSVFSLIIFLFPNSLLRFKELVNPKTYSKKVDLNNSTSIRLAIYNCDFELINNTGFFGIGMGDVKDKLQECYKQNHPEIFGEEYNSHNVYINILIGLGWLGLLYFILFLFLLYKMSFKNKDILFTTIITFFLVIFLFENVLDRQNGVLLFTFLTNFYIYKNTFIIAKS